MKIGCKLMKSLYSQVRNIQNSSRNWSDVTSLMTSSWRHFIKFVNTSWLKIKSSFVKIGCKLIKLLYSQVWNILNPSRNWSAVTSLSSWRHSIKFVNTTWLSIISGLVNIWCKLTKLLYSRVWNILNPNGNCSAVTSPMTSSLRHITGCKLIKLLCSQARNMLFQPISVSYDVT